MRYESLEQYVSDVKRQAANYHHVFFYGAGISSAEHDKKLRAAGIHAEGFVVTSKKENWRELRGLPVLQLSELATEPEDTLIVIATQRDYQQDIIESLRTAGYPHYTDTGEDDWWIKPIEAERRERAAIEITTRIGCSVNCRFCPQSLLLKRYYRNNKRRKSVLSLEDFKRCLNHLPSDAIITFSGFAEPFLNPACADMILATVAHGNKISLHTTLVGMTMEDFERIKDVPFEYLTLHLPDVDGYADIPVTEEYKRVLDHVLDAKKPDGTPWVTSSNSQSHPPQELMDFINRRVTYTDIHLIDRAGSLDDDRVAEDIYLKGPIYCPKSPELRRNILLPDGTLVLCCMDFGLHHELGNLIRHTFDKIRDGDVFRKILQKMDVEDSDVICRKCSIARTR